MSTPLILADDLSGAAEAAAALGGHQGADIVLWPAPLVLSGRPLVVDLDCRQASAAEAERRVRAALVAAPTAFPVVTKIDSLLRGNVEACVRPLLSAAGVVLLAPALPAQERSVRNGILFDHGTALNRTTLWALEPAPAPPNVAAVLGDVPVTGIDLTTVRSTRLPEALRAAVGTVAICDAETQSDLQTLIEAGLDAGVPVRLVGSGALARALGRYLTDPSPAAMEVKPRSASQGILYVLGTGSTQAVEQVALLRERVPLCVVTLEPTDLMDLSDDLARSTAQRLGEHLRIGDVLIQIARTAGPEGSGARITQGLARLVSVLLRTTPLWPVRLMLTGGQTARAVLDALNCDHLTAEAEIHPGAVLCTTEDGWSVVTRPGSHGDRESLWTIRQALNSSHPSK